LHLKPILVEYRKTSQFQEKSFQKVMNKIILRFSIAIFVLISISLSANAQYKAEIFAITNTKIVTVSGKTIEKGTIVIRNGLIEAVGENISVPADAIAIDGSGLTIYPGFIDADSSLGIPAQPPRAPGQGLTQTPTSNSNYPDGLQPEKTAFEDLRANDSQFETQRNTGITTALTVGSDGIFNGQSAVINLSGDAVSTMIVRTPFAQHVSFTTLRGGQYPGSLLGTFAALRQMLFDTQRLIEIQKLNASNPVGIKRPEADASLQALVPVINGTMPVVFNAETEREIIRALDLAKEFNLKAIIAGGTESWKVANRLKQQNVPVLLSLNFPERTTADAKDADPENLETLRLRVEVPKNALRLKQAGVKFAFESGGLKNLSKDFLGNVDKAVQNGLSKDDALRSLTLSSAEILGVENRLGSIEQGKIANLVVMRGDLFDKERQFTHIFVDGNLYVQKEKPKVDTKGAAGTPNGNVAQIGGKWNVTIEIPGQPLTATYTFVQQGAAFSGSMETPFGTTDFSGGKVTTDGFSFSATVDFQGQTFDIFVNGKMTGNGIEGTVTSPQGAIPFSGTKIP
jgi:imidazolonepropionase-like amidohydrolase